MGQKKLIRFASIKTFANVKEYPQNMQGEWNTFFNNQNPVVLELACGRGEYTAALAQLYPGTNYIGVDVKGNRIYIGAKKCLTLQLNNAAFLRTQIEMLDTYFAKDEVSEIWITFPDPHLRTSHAKKRLTHPRFLRLYKKILKQDGFIHLKTDSPDLYRFTKRVIGLYKLDLIEDLDNAAEQTNREDLKIKTYYESLDIAGSKRIFYLKFGLPDTIINIDDELQEILKQEENAE
jgi:tRNA (guanine-N7-)-methyltransferase